MAAMGSMSKYVEEEDDGHKLRHGQVAFNLASLI
jgi:hypothetical protein